MSTHTEHGNHLAGSPLAFVAQPLCLLPNNPMPSFIRHLHWWFYSRLTITINVWLLMHCDESKSHKPSSVTVELTNCSAHSTRWVRCFHRLVLVFIFKSEQTEERITRHGEIPELVSSAEAQVHTEITWVPVGCTHNFQAQGFTSSIISVTLLKWQVMCNEGGTGGAYIHVIGRWSWVNIERRKSSFMLE